MYINRKHLIFEDAEATKTALNMVKLEIAIRRKEKMVRTDQFERSETPAEIKLKNTESGRDTEITIV